MEAAGRQRAVSRSNVSKEVCLKARSQFGRNQQKSRKEFKDQLGLLLHSNVVNKCQKWMQLGEIFSEDADTTKT